MDPIVIALIVLAVLVVGGIGLLAARRSGERPTPEAPARAPAAPPDGLRERLGKTRRAISERLAGVFSRSRFDAEFWDDLEAGLIASDLGVHGATRVVERIRERNPKDGEEAKAGLRDELVALFSGKDRSLHLEGNPSIVLVVGVNGTGKTTSIAKIASRLQADGHTVLLGAADTFRAAADQQLRVWAERVGVDVVSGESGADPASVAFDAFESAKAKGADVLIVDTAGRLQTKANLMDELSKIARVLERDGGKIAEVLLVIDGTTGQNALSQAERFTEAVGVTGVVLTKLDGTARGGIAVAVEDGLGIPVKFVGIGEGVGDLIPFEPEAFVGALLGD